MCRALTDRLIHPHELMDTTTLTRAESLLWFSIDSHLYLSTVECLGLDFGLGLSVGMLYKYLSFRYFFPQVGMLAEQDRRDQEVLRKRKEAAAPAPSVSVATTSGLAAPSTSGLAGDEADFGDDVPGPDEDDMMVRGTPLVVLICFRVWARAESLQFRRHNGAGHVLGRFRCWLGNCTCLCKGDC